LSGGCIPKKNVHLPAPVSPLQLGLKISLFTFGKEEKDHDEKHKFKVKVNE
jgi:hypothetical protein